MRIVEPRKGRIGAKIVRALARVLKMQLYQTHRFAIAPMMDKRPGEMIAASAFGPGLVG
jgi:hypothetical protein